MKISLKRQLTAITLLATVMPILIIMLLAMIRQTNVLALVEQELDNLANQTVDQAARDVYSLCQSVDGLLQNAVNRELAVARNILQRAGAPSLGQETDTWEIINQSTGEARSATIPRMNFGVNFLAKNTDPAKRTPIVDEASRLAGGACTIFQRVAEPRGMLRIATTIRGADGMRAVGTFMPQTNPDGTANPIIATVLKGETFRGSTYIINARYVAAYAPIRDANNRVIGMICVGEKIGDVKAMRRSVLDLSIGKSGYVSVLDANPEHKGRYIISMKDPSAPPGSYIGLRDGENPLRDPDPRVRDVISHFIDGAMSAPEGKTARLSYQWKNPGDPELREKTGAALYFKPWGGVIVATAYEDDFLAARNHLRSAFTSLSWQVAVFVVVIFLIVAAAATALGALIFKPFAYLSGIAEKIAGGDIFGAGEVLASHPDMKKGAPEIKIIMQAFDSMISSLHGLIAKMRQAGIQVTASSTQIAASARQVEATASEQVASSQEVSSASRDIADASGKLHTAVESICVSAEETAHTAEQGRNALQSLESASRSLAMATESISGKLGVINDRAHAISGVITTITRISDQTNLLALNAAIEAEKAGEYGKGFAVVARETGRLADQTSAATSDIERMVRDMQNAVSSGVMEMDKFSKEVCGGADSIAMIGNQLGQVIDQVKALAPSFESVKTGMRGQAADASKIHISIRQLSEAAEQSRQSIHEFNQAAGQLNEAVQSLKQEISRFRLEKS